MQNESKTAPDLHEMAGELTALIGRNVIIHGEYSPQKMHNLISDYLLKAYVAGEKAHITPHNP